MCVVVAVLWDVLSFDDCRRAAESGRERGVARVAAFVLDVLVIGCGGGHGCGWWGLLYLASEYILVGTRLVGHRLVSSLRCAF